MYPEGEFLCIVSKQYDRGTQEDQNAYVSERVKVSNDRRTALATTFCSLDFTRTWFTHVMICVSLNLENVICPISLHMYWLLCVCLLVGSFSVNKVLLLSSSSRVCVCVRALASHATVFLLISDQSQCVHIS